MKKRYITHCDMGMVKIFTKDVSLFFFNNIGDIGTAVDVYIKKPRISKERLGEYIGHFTVKSEHSVWLSGDDCEDEKIHMFGIGRWWVHLTTPAHLSIIKQDMEVHA